MVKVVKASKSGTLTCLQLPSVSTALTLVAPATAIRGHRPCSCCFCHCHPWAQPLLLLLLPLPATRSTRGCGGAGRAESRTQTLNPTTRRGKPYTLTFLQLPNVAPVVLFLGATGLALGPSALEQHCSAADLSAYSRAGNVPSGAVYGVRNSSL